MPKVSAEVAKLGERELAKRRRREERDANFTKAAQAFVELLQQALDRGEDCSIVAWVHEGSAGGQIFEKTKYNPLLPALRIRNKQLGLGLSPEKPPKTITASLSQTAEAHFQVWPFVGAWEATIINRVMKDRIVVPSGLTLSAHFMDVRGVNGVVLKG